MAGADRSADAVWRGDLASGQGTVKLRSGVAGEMPVGWDERVGSSSDGKTSPEELIAAAHATCFSMALSHGLGESGNAPRQLDVTATCTIEKGAAGFGISRMRLEVVGDVPGLDEAAFRTAADEAGKGCPVSRALAGNVDIQVEARLR